MMVVSLLGVAEGATPARPADRPPTTKGVRTASPAKPSLAQASPVVRRWMNRMTLRDEVAQLVFIAFHGESPNTRSREYRKFMRLISETRIGGLILNNVANGRVVQKAEAYRVAAFLNRMQKMALVPLMVGGDFERGASMRVDGTTVFPPRHGVWSGGRPGAGSL
jgi:beta-N-acetylhexosaminidase